MGRVLSYVTKLEQKKNGFGMYINWARKKNNASEIEFSRVSKM